MSHPSTPLLNWSQNPQENAEATQATQADGANDLPEQEGQGTGGGGGFSFLPLIIIGVIFWVLLIGPERKARKKQETMRNELKKGDEVMTTGGLFGKITAINENKITLQIAEGVKVKFLRQAIQGRVGDELDESGGEKDPRKQAKEEKPSKEKETAGA